MTITMV